MDETPSRTPVRPGPVLIVALGLAALGVSAWYAGALFFVHPPPWPDEALFADVAANLARRGVFGSTLYEEALPSLARHYYLTPPLYLLLVAGVFAVAGPGLVALRATSLAIALAVLALLFGIARRAGMGRAAALGVVGLAAVDLTFARASHNGRMDTLALGFVLMTLWIGLRPAGAGASAARAFAMGCAAALAFLSHPLGLVAGPMGMILLAAAPPQDRHREPGGPAAHARRFLPGIAAPMLLGFALCLLPWGLYIADDFPGFAAQFGNQLTRKLGRELSGVCLPALASQWPVSAPWLAGAGIAGNAGLFLAGRDSPRARGLWIGQLLLMVAVLAGCELWYAVYLVPLGALGMVRMVALAGVPGRWRGLAGAAGAVVAGIWALANVLGLTVLDSLRREGRQGAVEYRAWCRGIAEALPAGSTAMLEIAPTPWFGLVESGTLRLRFFRPAGFRLDAAAERAALAGGDYLVTGREPLSRTLDERVRDHGALVTEIGSRDGAGYFARIIRIREPAESGAAPAARESPLRSR